MGAEMKLQTSTVLIHYDDIIRCTDIFLLRIIQSKYYDQFKDYINIDAYANLTDEDLLYLYAARTVINPFEWLKKQDFDYEANYNYFKNKYKNLYISSIFLHFKETLEALDKAYFIKEIIFYSKEYDKRLEFDIRTYFIDDKYLYITGDIEAICEEYNVEAIVYPYLDDTIKNLIKNNAHMVFFIPNYGFNIDESGLLKGIPNSIKNIASYPAIGNTEIKYFG